MSGSTIDKYKPAVSAEARYDDVEGSQLTNVKGVLFPCLAQNPRHVVLPAPTFQRDVRSWPYPWFFCHYKGCVARTYESRQELWNHVVAHHENALTDEEIAFMLNIADYEHALGVDSKYPAKLEVYLTRMRNHNHLSAYKDALSLINLIFRTRPAGRAGLYEMLNDIKTRIAGFKDIELDDCRDQTDYDSRRQEAERVEACLISEAGTQLVCPNEKHMVFE